MFGAHAGHHLPSLTVFPAPGGPARTGSLGTHGADHLEGLFWAGGPEHLHAPHPICILGCKTHPAWLPSLGWQLHLCLLHHSGCLGDEFQEVMRLDLELGGTKWNR